MESHFLSVVFVISLYTLNTTWFKGHGHLLNIVAPRFVFPFQATEASPTRRCMQQKEYIIII